MNPVDMEMLLSDKSIARFSNHTRWLAQQHRKQVIWIYVLAHMLSVEASAGVRKYNHPNGSMNFGLRCQ